MIGILNEKPSQARNFAAALGGMKGTFNGEQYVIVPARGHLYGFVDDPSKQVSPALSSQYGSWKIENLPWNEGDFKWTYGQKKDASEALKNIKTVLSACDEIVIATDDDPTGEGELLAWEIISLLNLRVKKYTRMFFADESEKEIQKAFKSRKLLGTSLSCMYDDPDYKQALFRTKWDYLSMQWTRIATNYSPYGQVPRQGRLKSAMIKIVGDQLEAVKNYVKKPYFQAKFKDENGVIYTNSEEPTFDSKNDVPIGQYHASDVVCDSKNMKSTAPPKFLDLASLGGLLAPQGVPAKTVLETYQHMYEAKVVSYPRTEDKCITIEQFNELLPFVDKIADLIGVDKKLLTHRVARKTHVKTGMAHGANRPGLVVPSDLDTLDSTYGLGAKKIYVTLARNYLATLCEDYEYEQQKGHLKDYQKFVGVANVPKKMGWKQVFGDMDDADEDESSKGLGQKASPFIYEGANPKPQAPTMKWLMKQLEKYDVGTGATRTSIYADVTNSRSKYPLMIEKRGKLTMAPNGETSYKLLPNTHIGSLHLTEKVMKQMKEIYEGKSDGQSYLHDIQQMIVDDIEVMKINSMAIKKGGTTMATVAKEKYEITSGKFKGKSFTREWSGHSFTDDECERLAAGEEIEILGLKSKTGKEYGVKGKLAMQEFNGHKFLGFERTGFAGSENSGGIPDEWCQHKFSDDEKAMLEIGKDVYIEGFVSKKGNVFNCYVSYGETERGGKGIIPNFDKK